jgi:hypothetical protein
VLTSVPNLLLTTVGRASRKRVSEKAGAGSPAVCGRGPSGSLDPGFLMLAFQCPSVPLASSGQRASLQNKTECHSLRSSKTKLPSTSAKGRLWGCAASTQGPSDASQAQRPRKQEVILCEPRGLSLCVSSGFCRHEYIPLFHTQFLQVILAAGLGTTCPPRGAGNSQRSCGLTV